MKAIEALEAMKNGISVVAFQPDSTMANEMFQLSDPETIEIFIPTLSDQPAHAFTPTDFLNQYSKATFLAYNI